MGRYAIPLQIPWQKSVLFQCPLSGITIANAIAKTSVNGTIDNIQYPS